MKRRIGTALSVLGLLVVAGAAAAVNVRMLHSGNEQTATFEMRAAGDPSQLNANGAPGDAPMGAQGDMGGTGSLPSVGQVPGGPDGDEDGYEGREHGDGEDGEDGDRPQLTESQMALLRVSAMVRMHPEDVLAVARGTNTDEDAIAAVQQAAKAVGTTMTKLAAVADLPPRPERGHGGHGDDDGAAPSGALSPVTSSDD